MKRLVGSVNWEALGRFFGRPDVKTQEDAAKVKLVTDNPPISEWPLHRSFPRAMLDRAKEAGHDSLGFVASEDKFAPTARPVMVTLDGEVGNKTLHEIVGEEPLTTDQFMAKMWDYLTKAGRVQ